MKIDGVIDRESDRERESESERRRGDNNDRIGARDKAIPKRDISRERDREDQTYQINYRRSSLVPVTTTTTTVTTLKPLRTARTSSRDSPPNRSARERDSSPSSERYTDFQGYSYDRARQSHSPPSLDVLRALQRETDNRPRTSKYSQPHHHLSDRQGPYPRSETANVSKSRGPVSTEGLALPPAPPTPPIPPRPLRGLPTAAAERLVDVETANVIFALANGQVMPCMFSALQNCELSFHSCDGPIRLWPPAQLSRAGLAMALELHRRIYAGTLSLTDLRALEADTRNHW